MVMKPRDPNTQAQGQNVPGNYANNLNAISRQSPTGKFVSESVRGQGMSMGAAPGAVPGRLFDAFRGTGSGMGNEVFSGAGGGRNVNTGISNLNRMKFRQ